MYYQPTLYEYAKLYEALEQASKERDAMAALLRRLTGAAARYHERDVTSTTAYLRESVAIAKDAVVLLVDM